MASEETSIALIKQDISYIKDKLTDVDDKLGKNYVTKEEFEPIKKLVYGLVALILVAVAGALLSLVIIDKGVA